MYGRRPTADAVRYWKAMATNGLAAIAPSFYVRLTGETGRGRAPQSPAEVAAYFRRCFDEQNAELGVSPAEAAAYWSGKEVLEYGPGDCPGLAVLMLAHGAARVSCVDRFPLARLKPESVAALRALLDALSPEARARATEAFARPGDPESGFDQRRLAYLVKADGLSDLRSAVDVVVSRAVLEHVNDLPSTYVDAARALRPGGRALHLVDLKSHGLHRENPLDFLTWPESKWRRMYAGKGVPNRHRVNCHREAAAAAGFVDVRLRVTEEADQAAVSAVRPFLDAPFKTLPENDLRVLAFWIDARTPG
jgi:SAM-dependent methyltransferase